jgi:hypothetical protein
VVDTSIFDTGGYNPKALAAESERVGALSRAAEGSRDKAMSAYRGGVDETVQALEAAATSMKEAREGRWNLPLLAMSAGMLNTTPGVASNFGNEMGRGLSAMVPAIQQQRMSDQSFYEKIAELKAMQGKMRQAPEAAEAEFQGKTFIEAQKIISQLKQAGAKIDKPIPVPNADGTFLVRDPVDGSYKTFHADPPGGGGGAGRVNTNIPIPEGADDVTTLTTVLGDGFAPDKLAFQPNVTELARVAREDQVHARQLWKVLNYQMDPSDFTNSRGMKITRNALINQALPIDLSFEPSGFAKYNAGDKEWLGKNADKVASAQTGINHIGSLIEAAIDLNNGNFQAANALKNRLAKATGRGAPVTYNTIAKLAGDELAKYISGSGSVAEGSKEEIKSLFDGAQSLEQIQDAVKAAVHILGGKMKPMADMKTNALGRRRIYTVSDLLGNSGEIYDKVMNNDVRTPEGRAAWGRPDSEKVWPSPTKEAVDQLKGSPGAAARFDEIFGPGAAARVLGG